MKQATGARKLGTFGAPTFAIGSEIFWGDDRLEEALDFASGR
jgi:2-hydroxychromene-2-carboxylate isomerase